MKIILLITTSTILAFPYFALRAENPSELRVALSVVCTTIVTILSFAALLALAVPGFPSISPDATGNLIFLTTVALVFLVMLRAEMAQANRPLTLRTFLDSLTGPPAPNQGSK